MADESRSESVLNRLTSVPAGLGAVLIASAYIVGFIVVNAHTAQRFPIGFELFRAQYLAAFALWLFLTVLPMGQAVLSHKVVDRAPLGRFDNRAGRALLLVVFWVVGYSVYFLPLLVLAPRDFFSWPPFFYYLAVTGFTVWVLLVGLPSAREWRSRPDDTGREHTAFDNMIWLSVALLALAGLFGGALYERIRPEYGGGASWLAHVHTPSLPPADTVLVFDRGQDWMRIIRCQPGAGSGKTAIEIPASAVAGVVYLGSVAASTFERDCRLRHKLDPRLNVPR